MARWLVACVQTSNLPQEKSGDEGDGTSVHRVAGSHIIHTLLSQNLINLLSQNLTDIMKTVAADIGFQ